MMPETRPQKKTMIYISYIYMRERERERCRYRYIILSKIQTWDIVRYSFGRQDPKSIYLHQESHSQLLHKLNYPQRRWEWELLVCFPIFLSALHLQTVSSLRDRHFLTYPWISNPGKSPVHGWTLINTSWTFKWNLKIIRPLTMVPLYSSPQNLESFCYLFFRHENFLLWPNGFTCLRE